MSTVVNSPIKHIKCPPDKLLLILSQTGGLLASTEMNPRETFTTSNHGNIYANLNHRKSHQLPCKM